MSRQGAKRPWTDGFAAQNRTRFPYSFLGYHATGQNGLEGALRATETSCVPLQEAPAYTKPMEKHLAFVGFHSRKGPCLPSFPECRHSILPYWVSLLRAIHRAGYASTIAICRPGLKPDAATNSALPKTWRTKSASCRKALTWNNRNFSIHLRPESSGSGESPNRRYSPRPIGSMSEIILQMAEPLKLRHRR